MPSGVKLDDRYIKVGVPRIVWVVSRLLDVADTVPHVLLLQEGTKNRQITLSILGLQNTSIYRKVEAIND